MKRLSDSNLKDALQSKLFDYEANVSFGTEKAIFSEVKKRAEYRNQNLKQKVFIGLLIICLVPLTWQANPNRELTVFNAALSEFVSGLPENTSLSKNIEDKANVKKQDTYTIEHESKRIRQSKRVYQNQLNTSIRIDKEYVNLEGLHQSTLNALPRRNPFFSFVTINSFRLLSIKLPEQGIEIDSEKSPSSLVSNGSRLSLSPSRMVLSAQPFLNYNIMVPLLDGIPIGHFSGPPTVSLDRAGIKLKAQLEWEIFQSKFLSFGASWVHYTSSFNYQAIETGNGIQAVNTIVDINNGLGLSIGTRYQFMKNHNQFILLGLDGLRTKGSTSYTRTLWMANLGYSWQIKSNRGNLQVVPMLHYGLNTTHYPGLVARSYWLGLEFNYSFALLKHQR